MPNTKCTGRSVLCTSQYTCTSPLHSSICVHPRFAGLGKTLQGISLLWTLLRNGHEQLGGSPMAKRVIIVCPTSLVNNWDSECVKWLKGRVRTLPLCESSKDDVLQAVHNFLHPTNPHQVWHRRISPGLLQGVAHIFTLTL